MSWGLFLPAFSWLHDLHLSAFLRPQRLWYLSREHCAEWKSTGEMQCFLLKGVKQSLVPQLMGKVPRDFSFLPATLWTSSLAGERGKMAEVLARGRRQDIQQGCQNQSWRSLTLPGFPPHLPLSSKTSCLLLFKSPSPDLGQSRVKPLERTKCFTY